MSKYFGQINLVIEAENEDQAEIIQQKVRGHVEYYEGIVEATADERVEHDEFGHAG